MEVMKYQVFTKEKNTGTLEVYDVRAISAERARTFIEKEMQEDVSEVRVWKPVGLLGIWKKVRLTH